VKAWGGENVGDVSAMLRYGKVNVRITASLTPLAMKTPSDDQGACSDGTPTKPYWNGIELKIYLESMNQDGYKSFLSARYSFFCQHEALTLCS
jgi:hypothetical protein